MFSLLSTTALLAAVHQAASLAIPGKPSVEKRTTYNFNELVVFGDELSDNGNGSYAHGLTDGGNYVYGFPTWTNGPVAVSYFSDLLGVAHRNLAWGGCCGGGDFGSTIDNDYTPAQALYEGQPVPSIHDQIHNEYALQNPNVKQSLQFIWTGHNDLGVHTDAYWLEDPKNTDFANTMSSKLLAEAEFLIGDQGAPVVMVANIWPVDRAPVSSTYLSKQISVLDTFGAIIDQTNTAIETALAGSQYADQIFYYDVNGFMKKVLDNKDYYGFTQPLSYYCDGNPALAHWTECKEGSYLWEGAQSFFWMNYIQPTTRVHQMIAEDMKAQLDAWLSSK